MKALRLPGQPLCEVFGFPINNFDTEAVHYRTEKLCPFNNRVPQCTKDKAKDPLGVCSIKEGDSAIVICPVRFRQSWKIMADVQSFLLPNATKSDFVTEVKLKDADGQAIGIIDVVLVETDQREVINFGALEIQAVYISGNVRNPFRSYIVTFSY
jgi:hypothetical protein